MWNKIDWRAKVKRSGENATNFTSRRRHVCLPMIVIRWHFRPPEAPQELHYEVTSQTCFAAHASSRLFSGRNVDRTRESGGNRAQVYRHISEIWFQEAWLIKSVIVFSYERHAFQWSFKISWQRARGTSVSKLKYVIGKWEVKIIMALHSRDRLHYQAGNAMASVCGKRLCIQTFAIHFSHLNLFLVVVIKESDFTNRLCYLPLKCHYLYGKVLSFFCEIFLIEVQSNLY